MTSKLLILLLSLGLTLTSTVSLGQTESETLVFINSKLHSCQSSFPRPDGSKAPMKWHISKGVFNQADVFIVELHSDAPISNYKFNAENIIDILETRASNGNLNIRIVDKQSSILHTSYLTDETQWVHELNLVLNCEDEEIRRIIKAFRHLAEINGATLPDEELFND
ncbi:hypothetical protein [Sanyastnella coralliicola]|uniref:hypothetical protein n=1 Tax=Sanyastnella coralliicola TaxID=3069118 RepID=UPI0027BA623A|nr:hypothetical protein [Longitalea sp. SCSIO 12813]